MNLVRKRKETIIQILFWCAVFTFLMVFFQIFHPLTIFNTDDWTYVKFTRRSGGIFPSIVEFNPIKVLPENLTAVAGFFGAYVIRPFCGDYVRSIEISYGLFLCLMIIAYYFFIVEAAGRICKLGLKEKMILASFVVIIHFIPFVNKATGNSHFFYEGDSNGVYNNVIPAMFNAITVCFSMIYEKEICECDFRKHRFLMIVYIGIIYLSINSNLFCNVMIASYAFCKWVQYYVETGKLFGKGKYCIVIVLMWIGSLLFEYNGGRAGQVGRDTLDIIGSMKQIVKNIKSMNAAFLAILFFLIFSALIMSFRYRNGKTVGKQMEGGSLVTMVVLAASGFITVTFNLLLASKTGASYLSRSGVRLVNIFFFMMIAFVGAGMIAGMKTGFSIAFAVLTSIIIVFTVFGKFTYADIAWGGHTSKECTAVSQYVIGQYMDAYAAGETYVEVRVPKFEGGSDNYPLAEYGASRIASNLRWHGMTKIKMDAVFVPDESVNELFGWNSNPLTHNP